MSHLAKRLASSAAMLVVTIYAIFWAPNWFFLLVIEAFVLLGLNEFLSLVEKKGVVIHRSLGLLFGALFPLYHYFPSDSLITVIACLAIFLFYFHPKLKDQALLGTAATLLGVVYVALFFSYLVKIRHLPFGGRWVFYTLLTVKGGDAAAYFVGKKFGKRKLIEHISPNKSIEGAAACFAATVLLSVFSKLYLHAPVLDLIILGAMLGILSQFGDLAESLIKRDVGVKDSGNVPGLGGILDVMDSLLFTVPFVYYYIHSRI